jgi:EAL domain-containing protein (putative c-di-GMP-specific phosphodiesterase class I)
MSRAAAGDGDVVMRGGAEPMTTGGNESAVRWPDAVARTIPLKAVLAREPAEREPFPLQIGDLHSALAEQRVRALYQPIVRVSDCRPVALEVLARLDHPLLGVLPPGRFIPSMETAGLGRRLTEAVLARAFADWSAERLARLDLMLALNFPPDVLSNDAALSRLETLRAGAGIPAARLIIELTEGDPSADLAEIARAAEQLRALGYAIAIDDISREMHTHRALLDFAFTALKLDKALVRDALTDPASAEFIRFVIFEAHAAGMSVTAEGVEDVGVWRAMAALGVDLAQGYLVSRALTAADVIGWHRDWCGHHAVAA